jgi:hypothetical protein
MEFNKRIFNKQFKLMNMKKLVTIATVLFLMAGYSASAQNKTQPHPYQNSNKQVNKQSEMMPENGKMQDMMNNSMCPMCGQMMNQDMPMKKYGMMVNQLPNMQQQLSLNDNQVEQLNELHAGFKKQQVDFQSELKKKQMKLRSLLDDMAPANQIELQLQECSDTKISMGVAAYETAGKMKAVLNNDQQELLKKRMMQHNGMMNPEHNGTMQKRDGMMNHDHDEMMQNQNNQ